jgi:hypothetical protein
VAWTDNAMGFAVPREREKMMDYGRFEHVVDAIEGAVSRDEYLVGDGFTAADVPPLVGHRLWHAVRRHRKAPDPQALLSASRRLSGG